jgi:hypothetical protein
VIGRVIDASPSASVMDGAELRVYLRPHLVSISRVSPRGILTNAAQVSWRIEFSEPVSGLRADHFAVVPNHPRLIAEPDDRPGVNPRYPDAPWSRSDLDGQNMTPFTGASVVSLVSGDLDADGEPRGRAYIVTASTGTAGAGAFPLAWAEEAWGGSLTDVVAKFPAGEGMPDEQQEAAPPRPLATPVSAALSLNHLMMEWFWVHHRTDLPWQHVQIGTPWRSPAITSNTYVGQGGYWGYWQWTKGRHLARGAGDDGVIVWWPRRTADGSIGYRWRDASGRLRVGTPYRSAEGRVKVRSGPVGWIEPFNRIHSLPSDWNDGYDWYARRYRLNVGDRLQLYRTDFPPGAVILYSVLVDGVWSRPYVIAVADPFGSLLRKQSYSGDWPRRCTGPHGYDSDAAKWVEWYDRTSRPRITAIAIQIGALRVPQDRPATSGALASIEVSPLWPGQSEVVEGNRPFDFGMAFQSLGEAGFIPPVYISSTCDHVAELHAEIGRTE